MKRHPSQHLCQPRDVVYYDTGARCEVCDRRWVIVKDATGTPVDYRVARPGRAMGLSA